MPDWTDHPRHLATLAVSTRSDAVPVNASGQLSLLRVHERGSGYGPPTDFIDVEVVIQFAGRPADSFGFQLRADANQPARQGMLDLLRASFNHGWITNIDHETPAGKHNGIVIRVWLTKPAVVVAKSGQAGSANAPA
jgi:hypothetical protein